jgi:hypothetical protein
MRNRDKPIGNTKEILANRYEETMDRLQKIKDAGCYFHLGMSLENY